MDSTLLESKIMNLIGIDLRIWIELYKSVIRWPWCNLGFVLLFPDVRASVLATSDGASLMCGFLYFTVTWSISQRVKSPFSILQMPLFSLFQRFLTCTDFFLLLKYLTRETPWSSEQPMATRIPRTCLPLSLYCRYCYAFSMFCYCYSYIISTTRKTAV